MTYILAAIPIAGDPLAGIVIGGSAGLVAVLLGAALLGAALNALPRLAAGHQSPSPVHGSSAADGELHAAA